MTRRARGGSIRKESGLLLHAGDHPSPAVINGVKRTYSSMPTEDILAKAETFFSERGHGYTINIRMHADQDHEEAVVNAGFTLALELPVMVIEDRLPENYLKGDPLVKHVDTKKQMRDFILVVSEAFETYPGMQGLVQSVFNEPHSLCTPYCSLCCLSRRYADLSGDGYSQLPSGFCGLGRHTTILQRPRIW